MAFSCHICSIAGTCEYISLRIFHPLQQGFHGSPLVFRFQPTVNLYLLRDGLSRGVLQKSWRTGFARCAIIIIIRNLLFIFLQCALTTHHYSAQRNFPSLKMVFSGPVSFSNKCFILSKCNINRPSVTMFGNESIG